MFLRCLLLFLLVQVACGEETDAPETQFSDNGDGTYSLGLVTVNAKTRVLSFPASLNMSEGLLEYAIVSGGGKVHESLLYTKACPLHINIGLKLLGFKESRELIEIWDEDSMPTGKFPEVPEDVRKAARASISLAWSDGKAAAKEVSLNRLIYHVRLKRPMDDAPWIYHGSYIFRGRLKADTTGDFLAIYLSRPALFNYSGEDRHLDDVWIPNRKLLPQDGTELTVNITHYKED